MAKPNIYCVWLNFSQNILQFIAHESSNIWDTSRDSIVKTSKKTTTLLKIVKKIIYEKQEIDGYGRDKRPETEKLKRKEITITEN